MLKNIKGAGRKRRTEEDYAILNDIESLDDIPHIGLKVLKTLGKGKIGIASAKNMLFMLKYLDGLAFSTMDRVSKQKYKLICDIHDQIQNNKLIEIPKSDSDLESEIDLD